MIQKQDDRFSIMDFFVMLCLCLFIVVGIPLSAAIMKSSLECDLKDYEELLKQCEEHPEIREKADLYLRDGFYSYTEYQSINRMIKEIPETNRQKIEDAQKAEFVKKINEVTNERTP